MRIKNKYSTQYRKEKQHRIRKVCRQYCRYNETARGTLVWRDGGASANFSGSTIHTCIMAALDHAESHRAPLLDQPKRMGATLGHSFYGNGTLQWTQIGRAHV